MNYRKKPCPCCGSTRVEIVSQWERMHNKIRLSFFCWGCGWKGRRKGAV